MVYHILFMKMTTYKYSLSDFCILSEIHKNPGENMLTIAKLSGLTYAHLTKELKKLKKYGLVNIQKDGRQNCVYISKNTDVINIFKEMIRWRD